MNSSLQNSSVRTFLCVRKDRRHMPTDNVLSDARSDDCQKVFNGRFWLIEKSKQKFWRLEFNSFEPQIIPYQIQYYTTTENTLFSKACLSSDAVSTLFFPKGQYTKNSQRGVLPTAIFTIPKRAEEFPWLATRSTAEKAASASNGAKPR